MERCEIRLSGSGGQGIILAGIVLAEAALLDGKNAIQTQSYGPEARGGASKAEVIISFDTIDYPKVVAPDVLLALTSEAYTKYSKGLRPGATVVVDSQINVNGASDVHALPIIAGARDELQRPIVSNIVALGALNAVAKLVSPESLETAVLRRVPRGTEELNRRALQLGYQLAAVSAD